MDDSTDRISLDDVPSIADETWLSENGSATRNKPLLRVVPLEEFISVEEDTAEPLLGTPDDALLDATGMLLMYGDGGAGKTTLSIDALAHLASGTPWLGIPVPRPVRILLIENEGPRMPFRRKLAAKVAAWEGDPFITNVSVLDEPWTHFTLSDAGYRQELAREIDRTESDLLMVGPLASIGAKGTGTPDDVNEFDTYIRDLRDRTSRQFAPWIVHHENKAGDVSGAWERLPDSLVHIQAQGNGRTRVFWRKVRWSSALHGTSTNLLWGESGGFIVEEKRIRDLHAEILEQWGDPQEWHTAREVADLISANVDHVKTTLAELVHTGALTYKEGPSGRRPNAKCWRPKTDSDPPSQSESVDLFEGVETETDSPTRPIRESESESDEVDPGEVTQETPSRFDSQDDDTPLPWWQQ